MDYHHQHQLHSSSSPSPSFFFSSPPSAFFHGGYGASPSPSSHSFLPPPSSSASSSSSSYSASFFDSSPLQLPRRSPRLSSRHVSAFSPSPSLLTRSLSPPSSKRCRRDSSVGFYDPPTSSTHSFDEPWTSVFTAPVGQASASSRSTPLTSREGKVRDTKGGSDRLGDRSITGDGDGRYTQTHMQEPDDAPDAQRPSGASSAKIQRLQQQLLRAASGDAFGAAQKVREDKDEGDVATPSSSSSSAYPAHGSGGFDDEQQRFPASSSSSASSTSSYPASLSSLSTGFSSSPSGVTPADGPDAAVSSLALLSPTQTGRTSPSSPTFRPGESCHQCKTRRLVPDLIFCSARHMKKGRARKKKKERACRKKYCARYAHLTRAHLSHTSHHRPHHSPFTFDALLTSLTLSRLSALQVPLEVLWRGRAGLCIAVGVSGLQGHLLVRCVQAACQQEGGQGEESGQGGEEAERRPPGEGQRGQDGAGCGRHQRHCSRCTGGRHRINQCSGSARQCIDPYRRQLLHPLTGHHLGHLLLLLLRSSNADAAEARADAPLASAAAAASAKPRRRRAGSDDVVVVVVQQSRIPHRSCALRPLVAHLPFRLHLQRSPRRLPYRTFSSAFRLQRLLRLSHPPLVDAAVVSSCPLPLVLLLLLSPPSPSLPLLLSDGRDEAKPQGGGPNAE